MLARFALNELSSSWGWLILECRTQTIEFTQPNWRSSTSPNALAQGNWLSVFNRIYPGSHKKHQIFPLWVTSDHLITWRKLDTDHLSKRMKKIRLRSLWASADKEDEAVLRFNHSVLADSWLNTLVFSGSGKSPRIPKFRRGHFSLTPCNALHLFCFKAQLRGLAHGLIILISEGLLIFVLSIRLRSPLLWSIALEIWNWW